MYMAEPNFKPELNISDMARGMSCAFAEEMKETKHDFDHFHLIHLMKKMVLSLKRQKKSAESNYLELTVLSQIFIKARRAYPSGTIIQDPGNRAPKRGATDLQFAFLIIN